ncbi:hypothetical protein AVEN_251248-1 [Araneus ventricosus]|uniref:Uncharacterized protein n=1 Tax=Araneus ventricosus TaxID=182803 RepID=A0A4Y2SC11_ARAVE|nr:hypothetical protein AVEN_49788-1 [Araneus ventricosus]GBN84810.1 hypothetical protein AVEN_251248-1 [Araneus ventricosus]
MTSGSFFYWVLMEPLWRKQVLMVTPEASSRSSLRCARLLTLPSASYSPARPSKPITTSELLITRTGGFSMSLDTGDMFPVILILTSVVTISGDYCI